jgi:flagellar basal-body rod protein FlgG
MPSAALQVARTGLEAQDTRMRVISNNLANVSTTAFKRDRANFDAGLSGYAHRRAAVIEPVGLCHGAEPGHGRGVQSTTRDDTQGTLSSTGNSLDVAINGRAISRC